MRKGKARITDCLDAKPDKIGGADQFESGEKLCARQNERRKTKSASDDKERKSR